MSNPLATYAAMQSYASAAFNAVDAQPMSPRRRKQHKRHGLRIAQLASEHLANNPDHAHELVKVERAVGSVMGIIAAYLLWWLIEAIVMALVKRLFADGHKVVGGRWA